MNIPSRTEVTAGVPSAPPDGRPRGRRRAVVAGLVATGLVGTSLILPGFAAAAVPTFPDNVVVFPDRDFVTLEGYQDHDFVTLEGYQDHVGQTATVEVTRPGVGVVGSAQGVVEAGDVAFEINHPGGYCWGAGTDLKVTPDIKPGDGVSIRFGTAANADADDTTTVADAFVNVKSELDETTRTLTVTGHFDPELNPGQVEQRIVNPELTETDVARRDIRAVPGGRTPAPKGGYDSDLEITGDTFKATYWFNTLETARIAATGGGERFMSWQVEDGEANRQGLTIAEYGELGGPGMGGCPAGPTDAGAPAGTAQVIRPAGSTTAQVSWTPTTAVPGAAAVTGYSILAIAPAGTDPAAPVNQVGVRTGADAKQATIAGLTAETNYTFEVRSIADGNMSKPFTIATSTGGTAGGGTQTPGAEAGITLTPRGGTDADTAAATGLVTVAGSPAGGQIWYTDDGSEAATADALSETAKLYTAPVPVTAPVKLSFAYFNTDGNVAKASGFYEAGTSQEALAAPAELASSAVAADRVTLAWGAVTGAAGYQVEASPALAAPIAATTATQQVVTGLAANTSYTFTVKAKNAEGTLSAASSSVLVTTTAATDRITVGGARYRAGDRLETSGTGTQQGVTVRVYNGAVGDKTRLIGTATVTNAVAPATGITWDLRLRGNAVPAGVTTLWVESSGGGTAGPVTPTR